MLDKIKIPDQKLASFMSLVTSQPELKVIAATMHKDAPIFKAHNIIDERWKMNHIYWCKADWVARQETDILLYKRNYRGK